MKKLLLILLCLPLVYSSCKDKEGNNTQDPEADWNVKQGSDGKRKSTYGFKAHANVDEDGFIKATAFTAGNVHDSNHFIDLLSGKESAVYVDSAYKSQKHDDWLKDHHVDNKVVERAYRNTPLTREQKKKNQRNSGTRCTVERVFGVLELHYGMVKSVTWNGRVIVSASA